MKHSLLCLLLLTAFGLPSPALAESDAFRFQTVEIDPVAADKTCYAVVPADVDGDGKQDIVVVTDNRVQWYQHPDDLQASNASAWQKHVIIENQTERDNVCIAPCDIDGDGKVDFALGAGWTKVGTIQWISRSEDPTALWKVHQIAVEPWTHRMRFADVLGEGKPQLVVSPLNATTGTGVRLTAYSIPNNPKTDRWPPTIINDELNRMHNHYHISMNKGQIQSTLTASQEGVFLMQRSGKGHFKRRIAAGIQGEKPADSGAGEVKVGEFNGRSLIATIEPMHGTHVVIYLDRSAVFEEAEMERVVLDDTFNQGHAVFTADMNGDGMDEVIAAHREPGTGEIKGPGVYLYHAEDNTGLKWSKTVIDNGGMACEDLICADFNGDGKPDIAAVGRKTKNLKLYLNQTK